MENQKQRQAAYLRRSLFDQGYVDDQFIHLEELQDDANPNFVEEVVNLFYTDSARLIRNIELALIGAKRVKRQCCQFQEYCIAKNIEGCKNTFQGVKQEHATLKTKLESYFQMAREGSLYV
ncbi:pseudo histidine-containing phosphotransfer protein 5 isoform X2 [Nicotiana tabacum]|uniref:Histidine-containing phosphotransfer protein n=1 Tax=Nicotiana tabacum TaxID=4097 RepID=A0A1S4CPJ1_TOBAC|nr:pseudo histidine-containing phosphotransfer protein 5-like isoform X2 [Nicotiana tomentosiformis]XP_016502966.1 PREDICTED: pseudo histidine-containing phosphotransfer protein 5-like isoform X2 [Nicotiana tabacum]